IEPDREGFVRGAMRHVGATREEALTVFDAVKGYQGFGVAESHAWAFALHAYARGWLRVHYPAEYMAAILTEEPGMWSQSTKRQEARAWGVPFLPFDINRSGAHYRVERVPRDALPSEADGEEQPAPPAPEQQAAVSGACPSGSSRRPGTGDCLVKSIRPPLSAINGVSQDIAKQVLLERLRNGPYRDIDDAYQRLTLSRDTFEALIRAGTLDAIQERRQALFR